MSLNVEQFAAANKATVDSLLAVANTALASAERIAALNLNTARSALEDTASGVQTVLSAKDPQAALAAQKSLAQPAVDKAVAYGKSVFEITSQTQQELAKMVEAQFSDFQKSIAGMVEMAAKSAPAGSEGAVAAIQNAIAAANSAFGNMNAVTKQFTDAAQANIAAMPKRYSASIRNTKALRNPQGLFSDKKPSHRDEWRSACLTRTSTDKPKECWKPPSAA